MIMMNFKRLLLNLSLFLVLPYACCFHHHRFTYEATSFSPTRDYDYIIVGGGTAGCPLATTLSQSYSVLVLERGGDISSSVLYESNTFHTIQNGDDHDSPAQNFVSEDGVPNTRARVLGGGSMINYGFYSRADDYFIENAGIEWDADAVERAYEWVESSIVTRPAHINKWQSCFLNALIEAGVGPNNGLNFDHVKGTKIGGSTFDDSGRRHGAVELLNKANLENLRVLVHATVDRVIFSTSDPLAAVGVRYHDSNGIYHEVYVRPKGEVILSAGALGSPQLLLLSGVGPTSYLSSLNIPVVLDHPFVGKLMADHPCVIVNVLLPNDSSTGQELRVVGITESGPYMESVSFPPNTPLESSVHLMGGKMSRLKSKGSLHLISATNVTVSPSVRFNYYNHTEDIEQCWNAMKVIRKVLASPVMEELKFENSDGEKYFKFVGPVLPEDLSDYETVVSFCRETLVTIWHTHGGCVANKVVDRRLSVIGVNSLRVVDSSTYFNSPGTNPQATTMMLGRYIGMKILEERDLKITNDKSTHDDL